jgi:hypothetical protein
MRVKSCVISGVLALALLIPGVLTLGAYGPALAGAFEDATAAYQRGDFGAAVTMIRPLAEQGDVRAQFNLATMYYNGQGVRQDREQAAKWFRMAAEQGDMEGQRYLGFMYANGQGVARNDKEAVKWYGRAAEQGDADAQVNLGVMYSAARGTSQNLVQAHKWFNVAASRYPRSERGKREQAIRNSERLAEKMSPDEIAEAKKLAREWQPNT